MSRTESVNKCGQRITQLNDAVLVPYKNKFVRKRVVCMTNSGHAVVQDGVFCTVEYEVGEWPIVGYYVKRRLWPFDDYYEFIPQ